MGRVLIFACIISCVVFAAANASGTPDSGRRTILGLDRIEDISVESGDIVVQFFLSYQPVGHFEIHQLFVTDGVLASWTYRESIWGRKTYRGIDLTGQAQHVWKKLQVLGLMELPDQTQLEPDGVEIIDGVSVSIWIRDEEAIRRIGYENPYDHPRRPDQMLARILEILEEPVRQDRYRRKLAQNRRRERLRSLEQMVGREFDLLQTTSGDTYEQAKIIRREGREFTVSHAGGLANIGVTQIPYELLQEEHVQPEAEGDGERSSAP